MARRRIYTEQNLEQTEQFEQIDQPEQIEQTIPDVDIAKNKEATSNYFFGDYIWIFFIIIIIVFLFDGFNFKY